MKPSSTSSSFHGMPAYSGITTRTSMPSARRSFGNAPATSARPPVLANGAHSDATNRTFSGAGTRGWGDLSASVDVVVDVREDVVAALDVGELAFVYARRAHVVVELVELDDVLVDALGGVGNGRPRLHDERPVRRLRQHQLARRLIERARRQRVGAGVAARQLHHALAGDVQVAVRPRVGLVHPVVVVALEPPR